MHTTEGEVALEVNKLRLDGLHLGTLDVLHKLADVLAVGGNRRYLGLVNLLLVGVYPLTLIDGGIAVVEVEVYKVYYLLLGDTSQAVQT